MKGIKPKSDDITPSTVYSHNAPSHYAPSHDAPSNYNLLSLHRRLITPWRGIRTKCGSVKMWRCGRAEVWKQNYSDIILVIGSQFEITVS